MFSECRSCKVSEKQGLWRLVADHVHPLIEVFLASVDILECLLDDKGYRPSSRCIWQKLNLAQISQVGVCAILLNMGEQINVCMHSVTRLSYHWRSVLWSPPPPPPKYDVCQFLKCELCRHIGIAELLSEWNGNRNLRSAKNRNQMWISTSSSSQPRPFGGFERP